MASMRRVFALLLLLTAFLAMTAESYAEVLKIRIDGTIHPIAEEYIRRAIVKAEQDHADALLIELSTPGGLETSTRGIIEAILASKVPVIVYVAPSGARAASAGFFILESADIAAMAPGTNTGAAHPVLLGGGKPDETMGKKIENDSAAFMRSFVSKRGRNVELAESAVRESKSWTDQEALKENLIDVVAPDEATLLKELNGRTVTRFNGSKVTLNLQNETVTTFPMSLRQSILGWLMDPNIAFLVLALGALALYAEFNHPGAIIPGVVGLIAILLAIFALNLLPTRFAALTLIFAAFVLFALEAKFASHGVLGIGGVVSMVIGALLLVDGPIPQMRVQLLTALAVSIPLGGITIFLMSIALKAHRNKVVTGEQGLVGEIGIAKSDLRPEGKVFVHGELWNAVSSEPMATGKSIIVTHVDGLILKVAPAHKDIPVAPQA